ncbi:MAG: hypothetical protein WEB53_11540 [Akkermansiaceae bacterium]
MVLLAAGVALAEEPMEAVTEITLPADVRGEEVADLTSPPLTV